MELLENISGLQHIGIPTKDIHATVAFYKLLGFQLQFNTLQNADDGMKAAFMNCKDLMLEFWEDAQAPDITGALNHFSFNVKNVENAYASLQELGMDLTGVEIKGLPFWEKGVRFFTIEGPNAEKIEFCQKL